MLRVVATVVCGVLGLGCAGTRSTTPRGDGPRDGAGLQFKETGWTPTWVDATETSPLDHSGPTGSDKPGPALDLPKPKPDQPPPPPPCPGGCDDGDPCTADSCNGLTCDHTVIGQIIMRYYNPGTGAHFYLPTGAGGVPPSFSVEGPVFRTLQAASAGAQLVYQQTNGADFMISLSASEGAACCGYQNYGSLGHGFATQQKGTVPLYRFYLGSSGLHFSSLSSTEGTAAGYTLEGATVFVCP